jgi:protocatechuate 3,4-dioxygenase alpha subunit
VSFVCTGSQTVGPFFHVGLTGLFRADMTGGVRLKPDATVVAVHGRVIDGDGKGVPDAMLEIWQTDTRGFGRVPTDADGAFTFTTLKPGRVPGPAGVRQAPHLNVTIFMRGLMRDLRTRIYFSDDPANDEDPILLLVETARRGTLMARPLGSATFDLEWNVVLQGEDETVFFDC